MLARFLSAAAICGAAILTVGAAEAPAGPVFDRITESQTIRFGYRTDAPPFSFATEAGPRGFSVELCGQIAASMLLAGGLPSITGTFVKVGTEERFESLEAGKIDVLCGATTATLERRKAVSFTIPTFSTGVGAAVSAAAPEALQAALAGDADSASELGAALNGLNVGVRLGTTAEGWLKAGPMAKAEGATLTGFDDHKAGLAAVKTGGIDIYFADQAILIGLGRQGDAEGLILSRRTFTHEPYALAIPRGDEELRLLLDRVLSFLYRSGAILQLYERHFGAPGADVGLFYQLTALPE